VLFEESWISKIKEGKQGKLQSNGFGETPLQVTVVSSCYCMEIGTILNKNETRKTKEQPETLQHDEA
jgi:hypothetical protein